MGCVKSTSSSEGDSVGNNSNDPDEGAHHLISSEEPAAAGGDNDTGRTDPANSAPDEIASESPPAAAPAEEEEEKKAPAAAASEAKAPASEAKAKAKAAVSNLASAGAPPDQETIAVQVDKMRQEKLIADVPKIYQFGRTLGSGASCQVVEGMDEASDQIVAVKIMDRERHVTEKLYTAEVEILSHLSINTQRYKAAFAASGAAANYADELDEDTRNLLRKYTPNTDNAGYDNVLHFVGHGRNPTHCFVLTELLRGGELFDRIVTKSEDYKVNGYLIAGRLVKQMLEAVKYCHDHNIVHRDLKPENFVFATREVNSNLVLIDYGCAQILGDPDADIQKIVGTAYYLAPELAFNAWYTYWLKNRGLPLDDQSRRENMPQFQKMVQQKILDRQKEDEAIIQARTGDLVAPEHAAALKMDTLPFEENDDAEKPLLERYQKRTPRMLKSSDVWSIGVIAYVMLTGRAPFRGRDNRAIFESIVTKEWRFPAKDARYGDALNKKNVPEQFRRFLDKCLNKDPLKRATINELLNDPFVRGIDSRSYVLNSEVLRYIKQFNYQSRLKKAITRVLAQNMTEQPAKQVEMHFKRVDVNEDGKLNEEELIQVCIDSGYDKILARAMARRAIQQFDVDGDSKINIDEFKQMWYSKVLTENDNYIARVFEVFDDNGDGHIDSNELRMILFSDVNTPDADEEGDAAESGNNANEAKNQEDDDEFQHAMKEQFKRIELMIEEVDKDHDGKISFNEFFDAMTEKTAKDDAQNEENNEEIAKTRTVDDAVFAHFGVVGGNVEIFDQVEDKYGK